MALKPSPQLAAPVARDHRGPWVQQEVHRLGPAGGWVGGHHHRNSGQGVPDSPAAVGGRADIRLAGVGSPAGEGLRGSDRVKRGDDPSRHDPPHAPTTASAQLVFRCPVMSVYSFYPYDPWTHERP